MPPSVARWWLLVARSLTQDPRLLQRRPRARAHRRHLHLIPRYQTPLALASLSRVIPDPLGLQGLQDHQGRKARKGEPVRRVRWVVLGLMAWLVLSVPVGILVGKVLKASREEADRQGLQALRDRQAQRDRWGQPVSRDNPVHPVRLGHPVNRDHRGSQGRKGSRDHPVQKDNPEPPVL